VIGIWQTGLLAANKGARYNSRPFFFKQG